MVRLDDDAEDDLDDEDENDEDDEDVNDEDDEDDDEDDDDDEEDEDEPETWQVGGLRYRTDRWLIREGGLPAKSWHRLTSGFELPRLARFSSSAKRWKRLSRPGVSGTDRN